jgi:hypothetical protein
MVLHVAIMIAVRVIVLADQRAHLSGIPFTWAHHPRTGAGRGSVVPANLSGGGTAIRDEYVSL